MMRRTINDGRSPGRLRATAIAVVLGLIAAMAAGAVPVTAGPAADRLATAVPTEIDGQPVTVITREASDWMAMELTGAPGDPAIVAFQSAVEAAGGKEALGVVQLVAGRGGDDLISAQGFALEGVTGPDLLALLLPALSASWYGVTLSDELIGDVPVRAVRYDWSEPGALPDEVLFAGGDVVWNALGAGPLFTAGIAALAESGALPEPSPPPPPATALEAILRDQDAGLIDAATALRYRYLAAFGEPGLPDGYAKLPPAEEDATLVTELTAAAPDLPPDVMDLVAPVIVRPDDPRSILHGGPTVLALTAVAPGHATDSRLAQGVCPTSGWTSTLSAFAPIRVWSRCLPGVEGGVGVPQTLITLAALWKPMTDLMGQPIPDAGGPAEGGDPSIDVYLVDGCPEAALRVVCLDGGDLAVTRPSPPYSGGPAGTASAYVVLSATAMASGSAEARAQVAHELMHVLQLSHAFTARIHGASWHWFGEASAVWAEHHFVPASRRVRADRWLQAFQERPFGLTSPTGADPYSAWTWPLFMEQEAGAGAIGAAWQAMEGATDWERLDQAVDSAVSFGGRFKDFAVRAWNATLPRKAGGEAIVPRFQKLDRGLPQLKPGAARWSLTAAGAARTADPPITFREQIPALGVRYRELTLTPAVRRLVVDGSGLRGGDDLDIEALIHVRDTGWERRSLADGKTTFCRDLPPDDLDRIILVLADHHPKREVAGTLTVRALAEPCDLWEGTMTSVVRWDQSGLKGEARATFTGRWQPADDGIGYCSEGCIAYVPVGTVDWTWTSSRKDSRCSASTHGSLPAGDVVIKQDQMLYLQPVGDVVRYWGSGTIFAPAQPCLGWEGLPSPGGFFGINDPGWPTERIPTAPPAARRSCSDAFTFPAGGTVIQGRCWGYDTPGYEDWAEWRLVKVGTNSSH